MCANGSLISSGPMTNTDTLDIAGLTVEIVRKKIKNLHIGVYPPDGRVRAAVPPAMSEDAVRVAVLSRLGWIRRKQKEFARQEREPRRRFVSGETHHVFGRPYRLAVHEEVGRSHAITVSPGDRLDVAVPHGATAGQIERWLDAWYREALKRKAEPRIAKWVERLGVSEPTWGVKRMKTKWGSCNPDKGNVWINLELAKKPLQCLDYVILHEMAHFLSPRHDELFVGVLDRFMPTWRQVRSDLNAQPLSFEPSFLPNLAPGADK